MSKNGGMPFLAVNAQGLGIHLPTSYYFKKRSDGSFVRVVKEKLPHLGQQKKLERRSAFKPGKK